MIDKYLILITFIFVWITACQKNTDKTASNNIQTEQSYLKLGGEEQYVEILKSSDENPVLIFIYVDPGWPQTPQIRK